MGEVVNMQHALNQEDEVQFLAWCLTRHMSPSPKEYLAAQRIVEKMRAKGGRIFLNGLKDH